MWSARGTKSRGASVSVYVRLGTSGDDNRTSTFARTPLDVSRQHVVAYHEAGHAVVADELGLGVEWIERNKDGSGLCHLSKASRYRSDFDDAALGAAGGLASGFKFGPIYHSISPEDRLGFRNLTVQQKKDAVERASEILRSRWAEVEALANRLLTDPDGFVPIPFPRDFSNP